MDTKRKMLMFQKANANIMAIDMSFFGRSSVRQKPAGDQKAENFSARSNNLH
jgi:hypothetical protein